MKTVIVLGSSRSDGNTRQIVEILRKNLRADLIDLSRLDFSFYDYQHRNQTDDFLPTMKKIAEYELVIFATPVYWYSMSGILKTFFDRITDCLKIDKETGRKLRGKAMAALSCGSEETEIEGFFVPFRLTAEYLGMIYLGHLHTWIDDSLPEAKVLEKLNEFSKKLKNG